jgi:hypothetical protein
MNFELTPHYIIILLLAKSALYRDRSTSLRFFNPLRSTLEYIACLIRKTTFHEFSPNTYTKLF